ncbi:HD domain-containing protein [Paractinoplanes brasiliensis]|uniref:HD domain-containing protein n=1 Tax=Paractinoplanes brasiliensis TaxID=52695 RepID=A0A4R6JM02_9ACTN|nr:HD domain-containing protein [Actinoplanes brasiliensis]TDO37169.1 HD domain-containing protein [Actinoplanes brasiliensis]GID32914.1 metal-dependent phosphohydrolase, HD subdomain protein [Actinoplanes brasiliensis]
MDQVEPARDLARLLLAESIPRRWFHSQGVGRKAESVAHLLGDDGSALVAAAWLHDVGYAPDLVVTGMHQLDGARYLRDVAHADDLICRLVAHHSCAFIEARNRGLSDQLADEFAPVEGLASHAITYADMTTTPDGEPTEVELRLAEILARYGDGNLVAESIREASPLIINSVRVIMAALGES